jgi:hypothetical protein
MKMKKTTKTVKLPKTTPQFTAANMKKGMGKDKAFRVANALASNLSNMTDAGSDIFSTKEIRKSASFWVQVKNILGK